MSGDPSQSIASAFSGWTTTWPTSLLAVIWLAFLASWVAASFWSGQTKKHVMTLQSARYRIPIGIGAVLFTPVTSHILGEKPLWVLGHLGVYLLALVAVAGIAFTWWARIHLGRFWSNAITQKEDHRIVDTGPYGLVRHPIYAGLTLAILATGAAVATWSSLTGALLISFGQWQKARMEEGFLTVELGPEAYGPYRRRVPMILPFLRS